jgi:phospholipid/cholesterol/gamma-HCH transport system permease protein
VSALQFVNAIGSVTIRQLDSLGRLVIFITQATQTVCSTSLKWHTVANQMEKIGIGSLGITLITGTFAGAVLAIQSYKGFHSLGSDNYIGPVVALSMARELGPVLTGLMVTGRAGSAIAAEIGTMRITEQIDALQTLRINVFQYLIIPRILAGLIVLPILALFAIICGTLGGYAVCIYKLGLNSEVFKIGLKNMVEIADLRGGMIKAGVFGLILTTVGAYKGFYTTGGAKGVGQATTEAVVLSSILIVISNYFLAAILFGP